MKLINTIIALSAAVIATTACHEKTIAAWETIKISQGNISNTVTATGTVEPISEVEVGTQVSGIVEHLYADYNSIVKKGQLIAELDKSNLLIEYRSKQSNVASAQSDFDYQEKNFKRVEELHQKGLISDEDYDTALHTYETAKNALDVSKNELTKARTNLNYATIYSPIDGVVLSKAVEEGQTVNAGMNTPTLFTIAEDLTKMRVIADIDEADIGEVVEGQRVEFTVDAYPNDVFEGSVQQVRLEPTTTSNVVTYEVVISAENPDLKLKPGLTANITIYTLEKNNVLTISSKALRFNPSTYTETIEDLKLNKLDSSRINQKSVWVFTSPKELTERAITLGVSNSVNYEVVSGLTDNDLVVVGQKDMTPVAAAQSAGLSSPFAPKHPGNNKKK
ncbi:MAG: efflux RND transporter periplasmic adaptor subunit [Marinilabiliaceae bacterium]|nr:efflux RND transporter periplasmic adaptor subunit [Marinilabiliaceae bacterium]